MAIPALGATVSGTVTTFGDESFGDTTIALYRLGEETEPAYTITVQGTGKQEYSLDGVIAGEYIVIVSKENHVTREYEITVDADSVVLDMKIHLIGDINGDGKVNMGDLARINAHIKESTILTGYEFMCADVTADGVIKMVDLAKVNSHIKETVLLW